MDVISALTSPPVDRSLEIQWNTAVPAANANPASSAPPGRRIPKVTASASQNNPTSGGAVEFVTANENKPSSTPPIPAIPAERAKTVTLARFTAIPDASAATSELRIARIARPVAERISA